MNIFSQTDIGIGRKSNQDSHQYGIKTDNCVWSVVCDGMGGANGGDIASQLAVKVISGKIKDNFRENMCDEERMKLSFDMIEEANLAVYSKSLEDIKLRGMGTTAVAVLIADKKMCISSVGDSRAYLKRGTETIQVTVDHSYVQDLIDRGEITKEQARIHPNRNIITRSIGVHPRAENDYSQIDLEDGDIIVSCSDGLSTYLTETLLNKYLDKYPPEKITNKLVELALTSGGADNITVCVIYL